MNWTEILAKAGIPEPPGYRETCEAIKASRDVDSVQQAPKKKKRSKRSR